ncbi:glycoside hydrolase family 2 protein [Lindgomyces ingoldianus]|uniref:Glycoside hydrolase family 2 protein n=1 Tax=Lindgomyces ingoldianus TaxID=673940 RepID=A0ACB6RB22_9PLEO|nr:glycoside hydrolase family 2 protein [Lindgomyces ingoldianus]KAF2476297.1 glycoside hydrolase family 2 protein [Lindgomyces ingoldianus]
MPLFIPTIALIIKSPRADAAAVVGRERISLNAGWRFSRFTSNPDSLSYSTLKQWILPSANDFIKGAERQRPSGTPPGNSVNYVQASFDDSAWEAVNLPHDWAIKGPFNAPGIGGGMGRLPSNGVGWYRRKVTIAPDDIEATKSIFLDIDGAMSYTAVWLNGNLVGGWPYGYNSFRLDLTPYAKAGDNLLAIRVDNALDSSRWYPGAGIYRNVWLIKVDSTHVGQYGTYITTPTVSTQSATLSLVVEVENQKNTSRQVDIVTEVYELDSMTRKARGDVIATFPRGTIKVAAGAKQAFNSSVTVMNPLFWGPPPTQKPNLYVAITTLYASGAPTAMDTYETHFGIRSITYDANKGLLINGQAVRVQGTCNHHDLGSLGSAFNVRAAERQLQMLQEMGSNALRTSHNPPAPELLDMADRLGFMVLDEIFDCWNNQKTKNDFHLIFTDWREPDLRSFIRRDRNHPSVIAWSVGNEVSEQSGASGGTTGQVLRDIARSEDPTRPVTVAMNSASAGSSLADIVDIEGLNYQGEGLGTSTSGSFPSFHKTYPNKMIWSSESSSALSTRGTYIFPVTSGNSATVGGASAGGNPTAMQVSAYELYAPSWGSSPDKVFGQQDRNSFVAGEFVWTGFDYIGEPTPYDSARSSYFGIIDMAGFKKDRFYLYQSRWRSEFPMAHILPHWTWPERVGQVTPVHVFSAANEAELFVNGKSAGRLKKAQYDYRFRWDNVTYQPGDLRVVTYKNGAQWAVDTKKTVGDAAKLNISADRTTITSDGSDLSFITVAVVDSNGDTVPRASNAITFSTSGPGQIVSTDNGDPTDMTAFPSLSRKAFSGLALAIVRANAGASGKITVSATADVN